MRFVFLLILFCTPLLSRNLQMKDFLDNCDWCQKKTRSSQPLDIAEWNQKCKGVPKAVWFRFKNLGKVFGTYRHTVTMSWIYSEKFGWIYNTPQFEDYFYTQKYGWIYVKDKLVYFFTTKKWDYLMNINS